MLGHTFELRRDVLVTGKDMHSGVEVDTTSERHSGFVSDLFSAPVATSVLPEKNKHKNTIGNENVSLL